MKIYPGGSVWRKWDLHVHLPGTKLSDGYEKSGSKPDWDRFADEIESSDVAVLGITDYFVASDVFAFIEHFKIRHPKSAKLLLPNLEFRLPESVNNAAELVHFHALFSPDVTLAEVEDFLGALTTQLTGPGGKKLTCANMSTPEHFNTATVSRADLLGAFNHSFGSGTDQVDKLVFLAPAKNDGIRAMKNNQRKAALADEIDKMAHAFFGGSDNKHYFLDEDRYETEQKALPKPVFSGCDAHNFRDLSAWLGKNIEANGTRQEITWIKADPTWEGLQQTLIEPEHRVSIRPTEPDPKDPYKVIASITFTGSKDFPAKLELNPNLNSIIGSRSSGKSALLAHIAYAVDPTYTTKQQLMSSNLKEAELGPAAGITWRSVASTKCVVEWADASATNGNVIYVPQNWLYAIGNNAEEVTAKIEPALQMHYSPFFIEHKRIQASILTLNEQIRRGVEKWFRLTDDEAEVRSDIRKVGDHAAITKLRDDLQSQITQVRKEYSLSEDDLKSYQKVVSQISKKTERLAELSIHASTLAPYVSLSPERRYEAVPDAVELEIAMSPHPDDLPEELGGQLEELIAEAEKSLVADIEKLIVAGRSLIARERNKLRKDLKALADDNAELIQKHEANVALDELVKRQRGQQELLDSISDLKKKLVGRVKDIAKVEAKLVEHIRLRTAAVEALRINFDGEPRVLDDLVFGIEVSISHQTMRDLAVYFKKSAIGEYVLKVAEEQVADVDKAHSDPRAFLRSIATGTQKLNQGADRVVVSQEILSAVDEVRFTAELEGDQIGGFTPSSMTPGKQALFALTLILNETHEQWPLLIDQPEDDLDSRSIYDVIVPYLVARKTERQIILVTHNANLVIGADSEEVIVANRHGVDRKNSGARTFDYMSGSLEHSFPKSKAATALGEMGIREHACEILDGGEQAFQKRKSKYKI